MRRLGVLVAALALSACARGAAVEARPPLWRVSDGDTTIWLLGSIHLLPGNVQWQTPAIERAIAEAQELVVESSPDDHADFAALAKGTNLPPLAARIAPAHRPALDLAIARSGVARTTLDGQKSWAAAATLATADALAGGASVDNGVEARLWARFAGRRREAFYRAQDQIALLDALPPALQDQMIDEAVDPAQGYLLTLGAWARGDIAALARVAECTPLAGRLVGQPNVAWSGWIARRMRRPGTVLVAVRDTRASRVEDRANSIACEIVGAAGNAIESCSS
jgi:uncharacterized protein